MPRQIDIDAKNEDEIEEQPASDEEKSDPKVFLSLRVSYFEYRIW